MADTAEHKRGQRSARNKPVLSGEVSAGHRNRKQVDSPSKAFPANMLKKLHKMVDKREKDIWREFDRLWADEKKRKK